jgi:Bacterial Ig-like domain (group 3)
LFPGNKFKFTHTKLKKMKKEAKNYKAQNSRFILLAISILLIANGTLAQCTETWNLSGCSTADHDNYYVDLNKQSCYHVAHKPPIVTDLATTKADKTATSVTIESVPYTGDADPITMSVTSIGVFDPSACSSGIPTESYSSTDADHQSGTFSTKYGITFTNESGYIVINKFDKNKASPYVGWKIYFTIEADQSTSTATPHQATRNYFFTLTSSTSLLGDPHITTVDGVHYDFQAMGEFVTLRADGGDNFEIQTRQTAATTAPPATDPYSGLRMCVSLNTAVAARVGTHRVTYEPDPNGMQLRVDGNVVNPIPDNGIDLGSGGRILKNPATPPGASGAGVIEIDFPDGASLIVTYTCCYYNQSYLGLYIYNTTATKGISGVIAANSWLPALQNGTSVGPKPTNPHDIFEELYVTFADDWRVTDKTSLFDYAPGTSTATFTNKDWPAENTEACSVNDQTPPIPIGLGDAQLLASSIVDPNMRADAIFDVMATGDSGFVKSYLLMQRVKAGTTSTVVRISKDTTKYGEPVTFTASVYRKFSTDKGLTGSVEFIVDSEKIGQVKLDANDKAILTTTSLKSGTHKIVATFTPDSVTKAFPSSSFNNITLTVMGTPIWHEWWFWLILIIILLIIIFALRKKKP